MELIRYLIIAFELVIFSYLFINMCYFLLFATASLFKQKAKTLQISRERKIAILIPGYREDSVIRETAIAASVQNYPSEKFDVFVIADSFERETIQKLKELPVIVFDIDLGVDRTKAKALNQTMSQLPDIYEIALVLDADNIIEIDFLSKINQEFNRGYLIVQGHRVAKNLNNNIAILDAISEEVNNKIYRKGHCVIGLPSGLIGSGMAFDYQLFKNTMKEIYAVGGFDKELELRLARLKYPIAYLEDALVYDEKVNQSSEFKNQRRRWLSAQFVYLKRFYRLAIKDLVSNGNIFFFNKLFQMALLPRILLLGLVTFLFTIRVFLDYNGFADDFIINLHAWICLFGGVIMIFVFTVPLKFYNKKTLNALFTLPQTFFIMFLLLFRLKGANKKFIHTNHGGTK